MTARSTPQRKRRGQRGRRPTNPEIARVLREIGLRLEMEGEAFKPRAYEKAAFAVEACDRRLDELHAEGGIRALERLPGVGKGIAEKIEELLRTGRVHELEEMRQRAPVDVVALTAIEGLGARTVRTLFDELGVRSVDDLERAARAGRVRGLPRLGARSEQNILRGIALQRESAGRLPLGQVLDLAREIEARLSAHPAVQRAAIAGSIRRRRETVGDLDVLAVSRAPERVSELFVSMPEVEHVYARGKSRTSVRLSLGLDADLRIVEQRSFGAALAYFTGSKDHNVALRRMAQERGLKLNEYGLFRGSKAIAGRTEQQVYEALDLPFIAPELRENRGEIEAAREGRLPQLIEYGSLRGDLQIQTDWTDGADTIEEMATAARHLGLEYMAVTDHTRDLAMARGADEKKLLEQASAIRALNRRLRGFRVLSGAEVNIRRDGTLDVADDALAVLDVVGAAIHSHFHLSRSETTRRLIRAMESPHVDILFHPTARAIGRRAPVEVDLDAVIDAALRTGTVLEIDAQPERLDLRDEHVRRAVQVGVPLVIDSDAHRVAHLRYLDDLGVAVARRGWARAEDVLNTRSCDELLAALKDRRRRRR
jgi:DNA polymerase (family 10)